MKHLLLHIQKEVKTHSFDYFILLFGSILFLISLTLFKGERLIQFSVVLFFVSFYIFWGIYHHAREGNLHLKTVIEYILIGFTIIFLLKLIIIP